MKLSADMVGIGRFMETVDNASDGESVKIEAGEFVWSNGSSSDAIALANLGEPAFGADDDKVGLEGFDNATAVARVLTITPTAANDTPFSLGISYKKAGSREWRSTTIGMLSDATGTATEICDGLRADLLLRDDLDGLLVGTGTSTLILTGAKGFNFYVVSAGTGICAVATTAAGTLANRSQAGIITGFDSKGPQVWSDPSIYGLGF